MIGTSPQYTVGGILDCIHNWAPAGTAQSYDNVGLQVGRLNAKVSKALVALDVTPQIIDEAKSLGAELIITHHPLLFKPMKQLSDRNLVSSMALTLAECGIALVSAHTNLDAARDGVSFHLAKTLGLTDITFLSGLPSALLKFVVFVPVEHADAVRNAAHDAGAGQIGAYSHCSFSSGGTGQFQPGRDTSPFVGQASGPLERVNEVRIEMEVAKWKLQGVLEAVQAAHPYEEVAYDVFEVEQPFRDAGIGALGVLGAPLSLNDFLVVVSDKLGNPGPRYAGDLSKTIRKVAVCGGSGSDFIELALKAGADAYVTGDITYHSFFDVLNNQGVAKMALIDAGHYESEKGTEDLLVRYLAPKFPEIIWQKTAMRSSPVYTWVKSGT